MWRRVAGTGLLVSLALALAACEEGPQRGPVVAIQSGDIRGVEEADRFAYRGIPYAAPPVDELRWEPPEAPDAWEGVRDGATFGSDCWQNPNTQAPQTHRVSEDCLYLNVDRPADDRDGLPVMVWLHGGGFAQGSGRQASENSAAFVERGVVLVSVNYRLGRLGYFAHSALDSKVANFGLLDQIAALKWVRDNIAEFGGDPENVTVFGQSAGGISVNALMLTPLADGLLDKAIVQSGAGRLAMPSLSEARAANAGLFPSDNLGALRRLEAEDLAAAPPDVLHGEVPIHDRLLPRSFVAAFESGKVADVPYIIGSNTEEYPDAWMNAVGADPDGLRAGFAGELAEEVEEAYGSEDEIVEHLITDGFFTEPARALAAAQGRRAASYLYRFSVSGPRFDPIHGSELYFVFDGADRLSGSVPDARELADEMADYWVSFARNGDPNHDGGAEWPKAGDGEFLEFGNDGATAVEDDPWADRLDVVQRAAEEPGRS